MIRLLLLSGAAALAMPVAARDPAPGGDHGQAAAKAHADPHAEPRPGGAQPASDGGHGDAKAHGDPTAEGHDTDAPASARPVLPGFAAELAERPPIVDPSGWTAISDRDAWRGIARSTLATRQSARWAYAVGLIRHGRASEALGVLDTMLIDDRDLTLVPAFQLAHGIALVRLNRHAAGLAQLSAPGLRTNAEACAWRMRALSHSGAAREAMAQVNCALPAINARHGAERLPFVLAAAEAAIEGERPGVALRWLGVIADQNAAANVLRGRAYIALGEYQAGRLRLERVEVAGTVEQRVDARLAMIEADLAQGKMPPAKAIEALDALRFGWRGGPVEERALRLTFNLATRTGDLRAQLRSGAALFRYFDPGTEGSTLLAQLQAALGAALAPGSGTPLAEAAGLYWDYRELAPGGAEGDLLVTHLATRLERAGLYARAAELLDYQLRQRAQDVVQGPLSVRVATLYILAGVPDRALAALRDTEQPGFTQDMQWDRKRVEAVALHQLGKDPAALAAVEGIPGGDTIRAEILWKRQDWESYASVSEALMPTAMPLSEAAQAAILRRAIALAMLGREGALAALRGRYAKAFEGLPSADVFDILTRASGAADPASVAKALASIPTASPAGSIGDLLDAAPEVRTPAGKKPARPAA